MSIADTPYVVVFGYFIVADIINKENTKGTRNLVVQTLIIPSTLYYVA